MKVNRLTSGSAVRYPNAGIGGQCAATARTQKGQSGGHHSRADTGENHSFKVPEGADRSSNAGSYIRAYKSALELLRIVTGAPEMIRLPGILGDSGPRNHLTRSMYM